MEWQFFTDLLKGVFLSFNSIIQSLPAYIGIISFAFYKLGGNVKSNFLLKIKKYAVHLLWGGILISVILNSYSLYKNKEPKFATPDELTQSVLKNRDVKLSDLTREDFIIRNKTFDGCHIYGPAVIHAKNSIIQDCKWKRITPEGALIVTTNKKVSGAILFDNCIIKNCTLYRISFIGSESQIAEIKAKSVF